MENPVTQAVDPNLVGSYNTRRAIVVTSLFFTWILIGLIVYYGSGDNSLHTSALSWAFATNLAVLFAYSFGTVIYNFFNK